MFADAMKRIGSDGESLLEDGVEFPLPLRDVIVQQPALDQSGVMENRKRQTRARYVRGSAARVWSRSADSLQDEASCVIAGSGGMTLSLCDSVKWRAVALGCARRST